MTDGVFETDLLSPGNPAAGLFTPEDWIAIGAALNLSPRELCIVVLIFEGRTRDSIARNLREADGTPLSTSTVRAYIDRLFEKLRVEDKVGLILRVVRVHRMLAVG